MASSVGNVADSTGTGVRPTSADALLLSRAVLCLSSPPFPPAIPMTSVHCRACHRLPAPNGGFRCLLRKHFLSLPLLFASFLAFQAHKGPSFPLCRDAPVGRARLEYFGMDRVWNPRPFPPRRYRFLPTFSSRPCLFPLFTALFAPPAALSP